MSAIHTYLTGVYRHMVPYDQPEAALVSLVILVSGRYLLTMFIGYVYTLDCRRASGVRCLQIRGFFPLQRFVRSRRLNRYTHFPLLVLSDFM